MGSTIRSSVIAKPMPCMIPPSAWLRAPIGLMMRPTSCTATIRSMVTTPVAVSTATCATWQPKVLTASSSGFGPRDPRPVTQALPSFSVTSVIGRRRVPSLERTSPPSSVRSDAEISNRSAARSSSCVRAWWPAERTAGAMEESVIEPPEVGPWAASEVSPACTLIDSTGTPSRSATTIAEAVIVPVPRSCRPIERIGRAVRPIRTSA